MGIMTDTLRMNQLPPVDEATITIDGQAITSAASYPDTIPSNAGNYASIDLGGVGNAGRVNLNVLPSDDLAGGTSLVVKLYGSADNSTFVLIATSEIVALAAYRPLQVPIPPGTSHRYFQAQVTGVGTHTAGSVTAWFA